MPAAVPRLYREPIAIAAMPTRMNRTPAQKSFGLRMRSTRPPEWLSVFGRKDSTRRLGEGVSLLGPCAPSTGWNCVGDDEKKGGPLKARPFDSCVWRSY